MGQTYRNTLTRHVVNVYVVQKLVSKTTHPERLVSQSTTAAAFSGSPMSMCAKR